jgi:hypothetical protein
MAATRRKPSLPYCTTPWKTKVGSRSWTGFEGGSGVQFADIVDGSTDTYVDLKPEWRKRKEDYLAHLRDPKTSASIRFVSAADKLHNATTILNDYRRLGDALWGRFNGGREGTLWYYRAVVDALRTGGDPHLIRELNDVVTQL